MTETPIVCSSHCFPPDFDGIPEYPRTVYSTARAEGWRTTRDKLFSMDGESVWLCPKCVERLLGYCEVIREGYIGDENQRHKWAIHNIWVAYHKKIVSLMVEDSQ